MEKIGDLKGKELFKYLVENKKSLIRQKKTIPLKTGVNINYAPSLLTTSKVSTSKSYFDVEQTSDPDVIRVKVVANASMWFDSDQDVLMSTCWNKSINENKEYIPHIYDHEFNLDHKLGKVIDIYPQEIPIRELGVDKGGSATVLVFVTDIYRKYNERLFLMYKNGDINQHSIGLQYVKLDLAINDEEYEEEYKHYIDNIGKVINKEAVGEHGYMWLVREIKLIENSAVLRGANQLTPTLNNQAEEEQKSKEIEPIIPITQTKEEEFDVANFITNIKFFNNKN